MSNFFWPNVDRYPLFILFVLNDENYLSLEQYVIGVVRQICRHVSKYF